MILVILHVIALSKRESVMDFLKQLPRNKNLGIVVLAIDCIWSFWLIGEVDLGEFMRAIKSERMEELNLKVNEIMRNK